MMWFWLTLLFVALFIALIRGAGNGQSMAITQCSECSGKVSTKAETCPHCGCPLGRPLRDLVQRGDTYLTPGTFQPYTGPVFFMRAPNMVGLWASLRNGRFHGLYELYHENGRLCIRQNYKDGESDGPFEMYYENGQLGLKGTFKDGELDGLWERYDENGQLEIRGTFKDGELDEPLSDGTLLLWFHIFKAVGERKVQLTS